jgi:uncharacterized protein YkwD
MCAGLFVGWMGRARNRGWAIAVLVGCLGLHGIVAHADPVLAVNRVRAQGCGATAPALRSVAKLNDVASRLARGESLHAALAETAFRVQRASSIHLEGISTDAAVSSQLARRFCANIADRTLSEVGIARRQDNLWIVVAAPITQLRPGDARAVSARALVLANQVRARGRRCGSAWFDAARPLALSPLLTRAALDHSQDMAVHDLFEHTGRDGSTPAERVKRAGYLPRAAVGENIAAGAASADDVMQGWLDSPGHCANLMDPRFSEMGLAYVIDPVSESGIYWTQVFASPR